MQINSVSIVVKYKSIIGIILLYLSKTISFRKHFFNIFLALELHLLFLVDFDCHPNYRLCPTLHTVLAPGISFFKQRYRSIC